MLAVKHESKSSVMLDVEALFDIANETVALFSGPPHGLSGKPVIDTASESHDLCRHVGVGQAHLQVP